MTNKEFKQLIKKHQVKQSFCRLMPGFILRFYKDTITEDIWCSKWRIIDDKAVEITVEPLDKEIWIFHWHKYVSECHNWREEVNQEPDLAAKITNLEQYPMQQRKYWKIWHSTLDFMLHDTRVE